MKRSTIFLIFLAALLAIAISVLFFPGMMSYDSHYQYRQVLGIDPVTDAHPPIMVYLWKAIHAVIPSPGSLLIVHQLAYWGAFALLCWAVTDRPILRVMLFLAIGFWPPLIIHSVHLWKDVGVMVAFSMAVAALIADYRRPHWLWLVIAAVFLFYGIAVRHNAILGALPLIVLLSWRVALRINSSRMSRRASVSVVSAVVLAINLMGVKALDMGGSAGFFSIVIFDMGAVSIAENKDVFPDFVKRIPEKNFISELKAVYVPEVSKVGLVVSDYQRDRYFDLLKAWLGVVTEYPKPYLEHRAFVFGRMMGLIGEPYYPYHPGIDENALGIKFMLLGDRISWNWDATFHQISKSIIYRPFIYLIISFLFVLWACMQLAKKSSGQHDTWRFVLAIGASGLTMTLPLFFITPAADYRYALWLIASTCIGLIILCGAFFIRGNTNAKS